MRPRKKVLLYCADAVAAEQMKWLLEIRCTLPSVVVTAVTSASAMIVAASADTFDCCVVYRSKLGEARYSPGGLCGDAQVYELLRVANGGGAIVELMDGRQPVGYSCAHRLVPGDVPIAMPDVVEAVKQACARKRGPHKENDPRRGFSLAGAVDRMVA